MKEIEIKNYYQKKIKELKKHNRYYFEDSSPKISPAPIFPTYLPLTSATTPPEITKKAVSPFSF